MSKRREKTASLIPSPSKFEEIWKKSQPTPALSAALTTTSMFGATKPTIPFGQPSKPTVRRLPISSHGVGVHMTDTRRVELGLPGRLFWITANILAHYPGSDKEFGKALMDDFLSVSLEPIICVGDEARARKLTKRLNSLADAVDEKFFYRNTNGFNLQTMTQWMNDRIEEGTLELIEGSRFESAFFRMAEAVTLYLPNIVQLEEARDGAVAQAKAMDAYLKERGYYRVEIIYVEED